jgi:predicted secreted protein
LWETKLTAVPSNAFSTLPKLKQIWLSSNQIKYIGSAVFDHLKILNDVGLSGNICVSKNYKGSTEIVQLKQDIKLNCNKPNDIIQYEIEHKIINEVAKANDRNQMEFKALNLKMDEAKNKTHNELETLTQMIEQLLGSSMEQQQKIDTLLKATEEHQKDRDENVKLKAELSSTKEQQKMELQEAKDTNKERNFKLERENNELFSEIMDLKIERQMERVTRTELRTKLMKANELLAMFTVDERISI